jgi:hypothetical protein
LADCTREGFSVRFLSSLLTISAAASFPVSCLAHEIEESKQAILRLFGCQEAPIGVNMA